MSVNPVWAKYCSEQIINWLNWLRNISIRSYLELSQRFVDLNPHYVPDSNSQSEASELFDRMIVNEEFFRQVTDAGVLVWANSGFEEFLEALELYAPRYPEINQVCLFFRRNLHWFKRLYQFFRAELILKLRAEGRSI
tara:strand:+ start:836 stop:1249 length:414 start_codon:yes stop_codon:yes gene_type:complete